MPDLRGVWPALLVGCAAHLGPPTEPPPKDEGVGATVARACWVEYARDVMPGKLAVAHRGQPADQDSTQSGLLITGEGGTFLIDGGMAVDLAHEVEGVHGLPRYFLNRASKTWDRLQTPVEAVTSTGTDPASLTAALPTHGHFDHLGGLLDLPDVPVWMPEPEIEVARRSAAGEREGTTPNDAIGVLPRAVSLSMDGPGAWSWSSGHDLMGDGSVLVVPLPGHTPGSVGIRVALPDGREVFLVGDAVWLREGYEEREPKSWLASRFVDDDVDAAGVQVARLWALHQALPDVLILPAHDRRAWLEAFGSPGCVGDPPTPGPEPTTAPG